MRGHESRNRRETSMFLLAFIGLINSLAVSVTAELTDIVETNNGPVRGEILRTVNSHNYAAFKGIPYAKPPLSYLRFRPPVPIDPWTEVLNATRDGSDCLQADSITGSVVGSEDCLFINVHTPEINLAYTPTNLKPVMVWIYGGRFTVGSSSSTRYRPDYLLEKGVVYVSFNYRLGAFGFLSLNHPDASGNAGLKDQVLALKWVKANIEKFGGNPNNVTIFGQSAGSASVGYHILSDASVGLFQAAISMSGVPLNPWAFHTQSKSLFRAEKLGDLLGSKSTAPMSLLQTLYDATAEQIIKASLKISMGLLPFVPTLEDKNADEPFLTECAIVKYSSGNFTKIPQLLGYTDQETVGFAIYIKPFFESFNKPDNGENDEMSGRRTLVRDIFNSTKIPNLIADTSIDSFINQTTELAFLAQIDQTQQILTTKNNGKPIYYYHISFNTNRSLHNLESNSTLYGAGHGDDLAYIFYYPEANYSNDPMDPTRRTIERVSTMWTNFAKYGDPTPNWVDNDPVDITWPSSGHSGLSLNIGSELIVEPRPTKAPTKLGFFRIWGFWNVDGCY